ncbi:MAG: DEAD/DEAH box helicase, partial [Dehalococcoidales bacterium]|nr:DEAD/DEAH box helicase [Dehalococcoidales bacterium]
GPRGHIRGLIISPTRELAEQTCEVINGLGSKTGLRSLAVYGGVSIEQQTRKLRAGIDIVVACPGRLLDHLWKGTLNLAGLEILVIDEADRMLDMGFLPDTRNVLKCILHKHQTLLFSATLSADIRKLALEIMQEPITVQVDLTLPAKSVSHAIYPVPHHLKTSLLKAILKNTKTESVLVFTRTKHRTERLAEQLSRDGYRVTSLQGNLAQNRRQEALDGFRNGYYKILVATDIAARGLDVLSISHVINYDMPDSTDAYIHRIGRTGRVNNNGDALTFVTSDDTEMVNAIEKVLKRKIERRTVENFDYRTPSPVKTQAPRNQNRRFSPERRFAPVRSGWVAAANVR